MRSNFPTHLVTCPPVIQPPLTMVLLCRLQYLAKEVVKDSVAYANACTHKGRACAAAGFVSEAMDLLGDVYAGRGLPDVVPMDRPPKGVEGVAPKKEVYFDQTLDASHESNQAAVARLIESKLSDELASQVGKRTLHGPIPPLESRGVWQHACLGWFSIL